MVNNAIAKAIQSNRRSDPQRSLTPFQERSDRIALKPFFFGKGARLLLEEAIETGAGNANPEMAVMVSVQRGNPSAMQTGRDSLLS